MYNAICVIERKFRLTLVISQSISSAYEEFGLQGVGVSEDNVVEIMDINLNQKFKILLIITHLPPLYLLLTSYLLLKVHKHIIKLVKQFKF